MKKNDFSHRQNKAGNNNPRRPQQQGGRTDRPMGGGGTSRAASNAQAVRLWMTTPSTLTSHIPMFNKRKQDPNAKKTDTQNTNGFYANKNKGKYKQPYDKSRQEANGGQPSHKNRNLPRPPREPQETNPVEESATVTSQDGKSLAANIDAFELFCAYHLGIGPNKEYKLSNINEIAKRFNMNPAMIRQVVKELGMDSASLLDRDFDMSLAQLDIQVAPEGIDRLELAKGIYTDYLQSPVKKRDWQKIIEDDRKENMKVFGKN